MSFSLWVDHVESLATVPIPALADSSGPAR